MKTKEDASDALREGEAISDVVDVEESKSHEPKTNVVQTKMQMQSVCDEGGVKKVDGDAGGASILGCNVKHQRRLTQSIMKKVKDGVGKEVEGYFVVVASTIRKMSKDFIGNKFLSNLKDLLSSRILEGLCANYVFNKVLTCLLFIVILNFTMCEFMLEVCVCVSFVGKN